MKHKPLNVISRACFGLVMLVPLAASAGTVTIFPTRTAQDCKWDRDWSDKVWCEHGLVVTGLFVCKSKTMKDLQKGPPRVGWQQEYYPGSGSLPCWEWASSAQRAYVSFATYAPVQESGPFIPELYGKDIVSAKLKWNAETSLYEDGIAGPISVYGKLLSPPDVCYRELRVATTQVGDWQAFNTPGDLIADFPLGCRLVSLCKDEVDVTNIIKAGGSYGFYFTPIREDLPHYIKQWCISTLEKLRLEVEYK